MTLTSHSLSYDSSGVVGAVFLLASLRLSWLVTSYTIYWMKSMVHVT